MAEFQTHKDCPLQVYRDLRSLAVVTPEKISHDAATKLIRRYKEALPNTPPMVIAKAYYDKRLEELRYDQPNSKTKL